MPRITDEQMVKNLQGAETQLLPSGIMMVSNRDGFISLTDDDGVVITTAAELVAALQEFEKRWGGIPVPIDWTKTL